MSFVEADLPYLGACDGKPVSHSENRERDNFSLTATPMRIADARSFAQPPSMDREGFGLFRHRSAVSQFPTSEEIEAVYLPEAQKFLREITGATRLHVFASGLRFNERSEHTGSRPNSRPSRRVHSDFSDDGTREAVVHAFGERGEVPRNGYWMAFNYWRVLSAPPQDTPLALCDMRSIDPPDIVTSDGVVAFPNGKEGRYEFCLYKHNPKHRWAYFSNMHRDEALVFLGYDCRNPQLRVPHSAFDDPTCPAGVTPRVSIEVRAVAHFEK